ncbi:efflux RND transporter periplasmic adaptor subunit [Photobacterium sp. ZSDE20]|uniref:Efflux RND transporter periplasmic adaptor subunit n=1 Tax=Photobacterium pectinilyticum TaxID=2906793 RepID=A0ABT1N4T1_9GAMM|nr:efflux RND transporter periplasmic adaptor subunit [Photobacterium sp. ZSDE20]MCQ1059737.1 efflux RND transporter periplasmic adaptor subunit [Photobacterium sp. ZSDE20]MDD1825943.1 efflux RND transporter periplasmic adaptor subunit [Photobacterium sp. ZSDE20]
MKRTTIAGIVIGSALLVGCNTSTTSPPDQQMNQLLSVNTFTLAPSDHYNVEREYVGMVQAGQQANLGAELGGKVARILADVGDDVKAGDPLLILDTQLLITQADELRAQQSQITAQLDLVEANLKRQNSLKKKGFSADSEIDALNSQRNALRANYRQLTASLAANQLRQEKSTVYAPYDGTISARHVSKGDVINVSAPTLTLLASTSREAHIGIPAKQLAKLITHSDWQLRVGTNSYPVTLLNPGARVDSGSRTVKLRFSLPENAEVIDGQLAYLLFSDVHDKPGYWIPLSAMTDGLRGVWNVFVMSDEDNLHVVERRSIQVLHANAEYAYVTGALTPGERLISGGLHRLVPGQAVQPVKKLPLPLKTHDEAVL